MNSRNQWHNMDYGRDHVLSTVCSNEKTEDETGK